MVEKIRKKGSLTNMQSIAELKVINAKRVESRGKYKYDKDKTPVECGCGSTYKKYIQVQHESTNKHIAWMETQSTIVTPKEQPPVVVVEEPLPVPAKIAWTPEIQLARTTDDLKMYQARVAELEDRIKYHDKQVEKICSLVDLNKPFMQQSAKSMFMIIALVMEMKEEFDQFDRD